MKTKIIFMTIALLLSVFSIQAAEFYTTYDVSFSHNEVSSVYVTGAECTSTSCTSVNSNTVTVYRGDLAQTCMSNALNDGSEENFRTCMTSAQVNNGIVSMNGNSRIVVGYNVPSSFGYAVYFLASNDEYIGKVNRMTQFNCENDICFDTKLYDVNFEKKANAIAEIGQLNIKNIDNENLPVQIEVPVTIEETVCSAYRFANSDMWRPQVPTGYSDYSAETLISLKITRDSTGTSLLEESVIIPIQADTCAGLAAFSWTPDSSLVNEEITFRVETEVVDNQVSSSYIDWAQVTETIYPSDLDGACWTRAYDFTLSNIESTQLTTSVAQISVGESLFALFRGGAYRDENMVPMNYEARIFFDNQLIYQELITSTNELSIESLDLSSHISGLNPGEYEVKLETVPVGSSCITTSTVTQTQNLRILVPDTFEVTFHVQDSNSYIVEDANINLRLLSADDYFVNPVNFDLTRSTNGNGRTTFTQVYRGEYIYTVSKPGYTTVTNELRVGSNMDVYITLPEGNSAPVINLPEEFVVYYQDVFTFDIREYISDFNDALTDLIITPQVVSGDMNVHYIYPEMSLSTTTINTAVLGVLVEDPSGAQAYDQVTVRFVDNQIPEILEFRAEPDSGEEPFTTRFQIQVFDADADPLTCILEFGDGTSTQNNCNALNNIAHTYNQIGTYDAVLRVSDGITSEVSAYEQIFVYERTIAAPLIEDFTISTSTGNYLTPTDVTLSWLVSHPTNLSMECTLRINSEDQIVNCNDSLTIENFNRTGISRFHIIAVDSQDTQVLRTIQREFFDDSALLDSNNVELFIDSIITPGEFEFRIEITNETVPIREVQFKPMIVCDGIVNTLNEDNGVLRTSAVSKRDGNVEEFVLRTNTNNFKLIVPTDKICEFKVEIIDMFDRPFTLSKYVTFSYPVTEQQLLSIRGYGTDITNFMESLATTGGLKPGFNLIQLNVVNNEFESKEISIGLTSTDLTLSLNERINLGPGQTQTVHLGISIREDAVSGMYPVRLTVNDGDLRQAKYTYILIE